MSPREPSEWSSDELPSVAQLSAEFDRGDDGSPGEAAPVFPDAADTASRVVRRRRRGGETGEVRGDLHRPTAMDLRVLYEDADLLAVDKPSGLPVIPERYDPSPATLMNAVWDLLWARVDRAPEAREASRPLLIHRIDRDASGVVLFAKTARGQRELTEQFERRRVHKTYLAIVDGRPANDRMVITHKIGVHPKPSHSTRGRMFVNVPGAQDAETIVRVVERFGAVSLVEAFPKSGRTHQIRVHLATEGHPLCVDALYGRREAFTLRDLAAGTLPLGVANMVLLSRLALHAARLRIASGATGKEVEIEAPPPADLAALLARCRAG